MVDLEQRSLECAVASSSPLVGSLLHGTFVLVESFCGHHSWCCVVIYDDLITASKGSLSGQLQQGMETATCDAAAVAEQTDRRFSQSSRLPAG